MMIGSSKPTASLSSSLLARRGHAKPAMRPQGFVSMTPAAVSEDLGWNDMGDDVTQYQPSPVQPVHQSVTPATPVAPPPVLQQRAALDEQFGLVEAFPPIAEPVLAPAPTVPAKSKPRAAAAPKSKAAFTLRLDAERHLRLRLASAVRNRSAQILVTEALDQFLDSLTDVEALARQLGSREGRD